MKTYIKEIVLLKLNHFVTFKRIYRTYGGDLMLVRQATVDDVDGIMALDYRYYPEEWRVDKEYVRGEFKKGYHMARLLETSSGIKGYYAYLPLNKETYEKMLNGDIREGEPIDYNHTTEVYLYMISIIVDIEDKNRKSYTKALILDMLQYLRSITEKGMMIKELGAIAVSEGGKRILESIGYYHEGQMLEYKGGVYPIYRAQLRDILQGIHI